MKTKETKYSKKMLISVPEQMLVVIDDICEKEARGRSELFREAFREYCRKRGYAVLNASPIDEAFPKTVEEPCFVEYTD